MKKRLITGILLALFFSLLAIEKSLAQVEGTMPFMKSLSQVTYYNPAVRPAYRLSIGLPGSSVFMQYSNNGFAKKDFITTVNDTATADLGKFSKALRSKNYINANMQADLFSLGFRANARLYFSMNATMKSYNRMMIPKDLPGIFVDGTTPYGGGTARLSPKIESMSYVEVGYGASYVVNKDLVIGAKLKMLKGIVNVTTQAAALDLAFSNDYAITVRGDLDVRSSGIHNLVDSDSDYDAQDHWKDYTKNNGLAIDLGVTYRLMDRFTFAASIIDFGSITWQNDTYGYKMNPERATYTFEGIDLGEIVQGNGDYLNSVGDTIQARFKLEQGKLGKYKTPLPGKMYLSGVYEIKRNFTVGALIFAEKFRGRVMPGFTASLNKEFGRRVGTSLTYTVTNNSFSNIGAGLALNFAPVQLYFVGDNLLGAPLALMTDKNVNPYIDRLQYFNFRMGLNFIFGRIKVQEKQPYPKAK
jgi:hypothetical protein